MNMKVIFPVIAASMLLGSPLTFAAENVSGGTIHFMGTVTDATCTINGNNAESFTVALDPINTEQAGKNEGLIDAGKKAFSLTFSNCSSASAEKDDSGKITSSLKLQFSSANTISDDGKYLINQQMNAQGNPQNVGVAIVKQSAETQPILLNQPLDSGVNGSTSTPE